VKADESLTAGQLGRREKYTISFSDLYYAGIETGMNSRHVPKST